MKSDEKRQVVTERFRSIMMHPELYWALEKSLYHFTLIMAISKERDHRKLQNITPKFGIVCITDDVPLIQQIEKRGEAILSKRKQRTEIYCAHEGTRLRDNFVVWLALYLDYDFNQLEIQLHSKSPERDIFIL